MGAGCEGENREGGLMEETERDTKIGEESGTSIWISTTTNSPT
jgi:hypothetical protein